MFSGDSKSQADFIDTSVRNTAQAMKFPRFLWGFFTVNVDFLLTVTSNV